MDDGEAPKFKHQKLGLKSIEKNMFEGSVYERPCPKCLAPSWHWCCSTKTGERISESHKERSGPPTMAKPRS